MAAVTDSNGAPPVGAGNSAGMRSRVLFVTDFYIESLLAGVVAYAREAGWELDANMRLHGLIPTAVNADGIVAVVTGSTGERVRDWLAGQSGCPIVRMLATPFDLPYPAVEADYVAAGRLGAKHLLELGNVNLAFYAMGVQPEWLEIWQGFSAELTALGRHAHLLKLSAGFSGRDVEQTVRKERHSWLAAQLKQLPKPLAIMGDDDRRGVELLGGCALAGLRVPEDVAILGCDDHWVEQGLSRIPLSSVDMNFKGVGKKAAAILDDFMQGKPPPPITKVPPVGVVARYSTATIVTDSAEITAAIALMRQHFHEPLHIAKLARRAGMSERVFQLEFKRRVGHSPREELRRVRTVRAMQLLRDTDLKLEAVAMESGFVTAERLCRAFSKAHGVTPNTWRTQAKAVR
jgi:LacI family transcriptional regulator